MSSLYLNYFGLSSPPFSITPDPGFFFEGGDRGVFIAGLLYAAQQGEGIILVVGEVGSGKTLMSRLLLARLHAHVDTVYLPNPSFSRDEIIDVIAREVVLIDEAHAMPAESIEEVRRLSNLETDDRKLVQLVLCGQPELDTLLAAPHLRQVRDRVVYRLVLQNLSRSDASAYLDHRLRVAGWRGGRMFSWLAEQLLLADAQGRARRLNLLADKALLAAFADGNKQVSAKHVRIAIQESGANFSSARLNPNHRGQIVLLIVLVLVAIAALWFSGLLN